MKPMIKYRGGKSRELKEILPFIPSDYDRYIEPFFGGGALYFYLEPDKAIINDLNKGLMDFYRGIATNFSQVKSELEDLQSIYEINREQFEKLKLSSPKSHVDDDNEALYYEIRDMFNGKLEPAYTWSTIYYFINKTAYSGMIRYNRAGEFNVPFGRYKHLNISGITADHSELLQSTTITQGDYINVFNVCGPNDFVFLDPPYDCVFSDYGNPELGGSFSANEHKRLAEEFFNLPCQALMVIGETELTNGLYGSNVIHRYEKSYAVNIRNRFKSESMHMLVTNR